MYAEELVNVIEQECRYTGTAKAEAYVYSSAISKVIEIVKRELPTKPIEEPKAVTMSKSAAKELRKKASEEEF